MDPLTVIVGGVKLGVFMLMVSFVRTFFSWTMWPFALVWSGVRSACCCCRRRARVANPYDGTTIYHVHRLETSSARAVDVAPAVAAEDVAHVPLTRRIKD